MLSKIDASPLEVRFGHCQGGSLIAMPISCASGMHKEPIKLTWGELDVLESKRRSLWNRRGDAHSQAEWVQDLLAHGISANHQSCARPHTVQPTDLPSWFRRINRCPTSPLYIQPGCHGLLLPSSCFISFILCTRPLLQRAALSLQPAILIPEVKLLSQAVFCTWPRASRETSIAIDKSLELSATSTPKDSKRLSRC